MLFFDHAVNTAIDLHLTRYTTDGQGEDVASAIQAIRATPDGPEINTVGIPFLQSRFLWCLQMICRETRFSEPQVHAEMALIYHMCLSVPTFINSEVLAGRLRQVLRTANASTIAWLRLGYPSITEISLFFK